MFKYWGIYGYLLEQYEFVSYILVQKLPNLTCMNLNQYRHKGYNSTWPRKKLKLFLMP
jgi:hypothetical protein